MLDMIERSGSAVNQASSCLMSHRLWGEFGYQIYLDDDDDDGDDDDNDDESHVFPEWP